MGAISASVQSDDTLHLKYSFDIHYIGDIEKRLVAFTNLLADPAIVFEADLKELLHGESVLVQLVDRIRELQAVIKARQSC